MSLPTGTSCITIIEDKFRMMLSDCSYFRQLLSLSGTDFGTSVITWDDATVTFDTDVSATAESLIHVDEWPASSDEESFTTAEWAAAFNGALIWLDEDNGYERFRDSDTGYDARGIIWMRLRRMIPTADLDDREKAQRDFKDDVGHILEELGELSPLPGYIRLGTMKQHGPYISDSNHQDPRPWLSVDYAMEWMP